MERGRIRFGMIGAGAFGLFAAREFTKLPGVELVAVCEARRDAARAFARTLGAELLGSARELIGRRDIDLVYVATPPFLHREPVLRAVEAGKHVICEKPLALELSHANEMLAAASERGVLCATNLVQRYGVFFEPLGSIIRAGWLGAFLHGSLENCASDEGLDEGHWFWDKQKSGGIFVEHGVHFFDAFTAWFGVGRAVFAHGSGAGFEDQVLCALATASGATVSMYHGFTRPQRLARTKWRLVFERGDVELDGWFPTSLSLRVLVEAHTVSAMAACIPGARARVVDRPPAGACGSSRRRRSVEACRLVEITAQSRGTELEEYGAALRAFFDDQRRRTVDPNHVRRVVEADGRASLALALDVVARLAEGPVPQASGDPSLRGERAAGAALVERSEE